MRTIFLFLLSLTVLPLPALAADITADTPWIRLVPGKTNGAGYFTITAPKDDALRAASSECCGAVEIHEMAMDGERMRMRKVDSIPLEAGEPVEFEPMGYHLMFIGFHAAPLHATTVPVTLHFTSGASIDVPFTVKLVGQDNAGMPPAGHGHHHHGGHE